LDPPESQTERDKTWLIQIAKGDRIALEKLYCSYHLRLARFLTQFSHRHEIVEEVVNDTFLVVWLTASRFRFASQVSTWIFGIAYRIALRSVRTRTNYMTANHPDDFPHQSFDPSDAFEVRDWLASGLSRLPPKQRLTLELCYNRGHSIDEIAEITNVPVGTVKARMFYARKSLRQHLTALSGTGEVHSKSRLLQPRQ